MVLIALIFQAVATATFQTKMLAVPILSSPFGTNQVVLQLVTGVAYPIEFLYVNRGVPTVMKFEYIEPSGDVHKSFNGGFFHLESDFVCDYVQKHVVTIEWDQPSTSFSSLSKVDLLVKTNIYFPDSPVTLTGTLIEQDEIIYVPISTVTTYWTGSAKFTKYI